MFHGIRQAADGPSSDTESESPRAVSSASSCSFSAVHSSSGSEKVGRDEGLPSSSSYSSGATTFQSITSNAVVSALGKAKRSREKRKSVPDMIQATREKEKDAHVNDDDGDESAQFIRDTHPPARSRPVSFPTVQVCIVQGEES